VPKLYQETENTMENSGIYVILVKRLLLTLTNSATYKSKKTLDKCLKYAKCMIAGYFKNT
jgi:hypothetical protein